VELERNKPEFDKLGLGAAAISYDSVAVLRAFAERRGIHFPLLSDSDSKLIRGLNLLNEAIPKDQPFFGVPYPGTFILDSKGVIVAKYFEDDYRQRYTSADILAHQFGLIPASAKSEVEGRQLKLTATASNSIVATGQRAGSRLKTEYACVCSGRGRLHCDRLEDEGVGRSRGARSKLSTIRKTSFAGDR
jgi:hypothetical protein